MTNRLSLPLLAALCLLVATQGSISGARRADAASRAVVALDVAGVLAVEHRPVSSRALLPEHAPRFPVAVGRPMPAPARWILPPIRAPGA